MWTRLFINQSIPKTTSNSFIGKQIKSTVKSLPKIHTGQFLQTKEVVTDPIAGKSITISPPKLDRTRPNLLTQSSAIKQWEAPVSLIAINEMPLIKQVPLISRSPLSV